MFSDKLLKFEIHGDDRGSLIALDALNLPIIPRRVFYLFGTQPGVHRGKHAHKSCNQVLICISGSCRICMDDGHQKEIFTMNRQDEGLFVPSNVWCEMSDFSEGAVLMVIADEPYDENEYIREYDEFLEYYHIKK